MAQIVGPTGPDQAVGKSWGDRRRRLRFETGARLRARTTPRRRSDGRAGGDPLIAGLA